ncbi:tyrosine--tRNA ligase [Methanosarcinales archaeon]|nr:MAG: tyrosine--tRNA ligase [Methanosarcinales archaeon]
MRLEERIELACRNAVEVITVNELEALMKMERKPTAYAGYEPSGKIHLGHILTVNKLIDLKNAGFDVIVLLADLHAYLNEKGSLEEVRETAHMNMECFKAMGLKGAKFVLGSSYQLDKEYILDVLMLARHTTLLRARRSMDEVSRSVENPKVSQMIYPLMQAADIAKLKVDVAVGGIDQRKIHMLARENLPKIGYSAPVCIHTPILLGLDGEKMSSSKGNFISVDDSEEEVEVKLKKALCPAGTVKDNPVFEIFRYFIFPKYERIVIKRPEKYGGDIEFEDIDELEKAFMMEKVHPLDLKKSASMYLNEILEPVRMSVS